MSNTELAFKLTLPPSQLPPLIHMQSTDYPALNKFSKMLTSDLTLVLTQACPLDLVGLMSVYIQLNMQTQHNINLPVIY